MLDTDTKRRIDTARDILVGKVPDPKSQVEQITIALIYKFMDDMDAESEEFGGKRKFFANEFARYGWAKLMRSGLGGHETLNLYAEAIAKMPENPGIPLLFRDIFKNAYLPYRDPETLKMFLKVIDEFTYDHSERLGDAFEYLLSVLGSQGDAGQFRTPRHIISFMVEIIDPKKTETVLDPACGTAGFLISSYKHILRANSLRTKDEGRRMNDEGQNNSSFNLHNSYFPSGNLLTPDEKGRIAQNFKGYDISPDMVRLSLVNLYLHGFADPHIYEYDTLTSQDRWNEYADVILANPPFMSPKGGIKPHNRFSVQSKRSEVLFVDYMAEHLTPNGRAGIIVPEGIIFQSQTAYKQLREMLVENYLVAVVSLPAGVFNPYSGVKTSILILDKSLAKKTDTIAFFKIENDGFGLGAQRREIEKNDLPETARLLKEWMNHGIHGKEISESSSVCSVCSMVKNLFIVPKEKIAANGDYNLSGERYREGAASNHSFPLVFLGETSLFRVESGGTPKSDLEEYWNGGIPWATLVDLPATDFISQITTTKRTISEQGLRESSAKMIPANSVVVSTRATIGRIAINHVPIATNQGFKNIVIEDSARAVPEYVALTLTKLVPTMKAWATGGTFAEISKSKFCELQIPLPPLEVQKEIVAEIEGYQKVINGARAVLDNYRPHIPIHPDWPMVALGQICSLGGSITTEVDPSLPYFGADSIESNTGKLLKTQSAESQNVRGPVYEFSGRRLLYSKIRPYLNKLTIVDLRGYCSSDMYPLAPDHTKVEITYLATYMLSDTFNEHIRGYYERASIPKINRSQLFETKIPLPHLATQQAIVAEIEVEQALVTANRELIARFEKKIQATLARIWGEEGDKYGG
jgi:type I restriction enzyme M protein